jgi:hypothetical protein
MSNFAYRLRNTGSSSQRLGACEVCEKHATEVFHQVESRSVEKSPGFDRYTYADCSDLFGHRDCLISRQRTH